MTEVPGQVHAASCSNDSEKRGPSDIRRVTWTGMGVNVFLAFLKFLLGFASSSQALIADAVHSLSDLGTDCVLLCSVKFWSAPADEKHPYGHQRIETMITVIIGVFLGAGALGIGYNSIIAIKEENIVQPGGMAFFGAIISIVLKEAVYRWTIAVGRRTRSSAVIANAWHHRSDALSSIPVAIAIAVSIISPTWAFVDRIGAMMVSVFIFYTAGRIIRASLAQLTDEGATEKERGHIIEIALQTEGVRSIHAVRTRKMGSSIFADLHVMVDGSLTVHEGHEISRKVKRHLLEEVTDVVDVIVHLEPYEE